MRLSMLLIVALGSYCQDVPKAKKDKFGISMGYEYGNLKTTLSDWNAQGLDNQINAVNTENTGGFSLGILYQREITASFALRAQSFLMFEGNNLNYDLTNQENVQESIRPVSITLPIHAIFTMAKDNPMKGVSPSFLIGGQLIDDIAQDENSVLELNRLSFGLDLGAGLYRKFEHFDARIEFIYSVGLNNLMKDNNNLYHNAVEEMTKDVMSLRILFFG